MEALILIGGLLLCLAAGVIAARCIDRWADAGQLGAPRPPVEAPSDPADKL